MSISPEVNKIQDELKAAYTGLSDQSIELILSAATDYNPFMSTEAFFAWLKNLNDSVTFEIDFVPLTEMKSWGFDKDKNLRHSSGKFFSIEGIKIRSDFNGKYQEWDQPVINQPEVGFLGILCQKINGVLYFLMQGKIEPGNVNKIQLSPTLQATKSNFMQVHGGNTPKFLEFFKDEIKGRKIIVDQLQSEQGARFLRKRNRNMIIKMDEDVTIENIPENFCWLTLGQIKKLLLYPNLVNMDTRTVLSCIQIN
jgi:oxidase EvaA